MWKFQVIWSGCSVVAICLTKAVLIIHAHQQAGRLHGWAKWVHGLKREPF
ncbi:hypothetical protein AO385_0551 [Moraxella catarrhalis]|uniref:Uncharacterized protein n=1 Tax=Moraxella catarrhalis TaxID=480 RepID=A0A198UP90_MORCA|nr:hypothetical protein AO383_1899 [Moraxella catarrhalis]OAU98094.1 hypothetical protein AO384_0341 [Moraxella catarrhalis]OAV03317.1 hypothetical protein AO385_0551 [Moraxella catarrhalis]